MKKNQIVFHSCYDELLSKLFLMSHNQREKSEDMEATNNTGKTSVSLISNCIQFVYSDEGKSSKQASMDYKQSDNNGEFNVYDNSFDMTAHEIIIYSLLLHKCIEAQSEEQEITYRELQQLRKKRVGNSRLLDSATKIAYNKGFKGLMKKTIQYSLGETRKMKKITYRDGRHPLLIVRDAKKLSNGDMIIKYSLGPFGKTLIESKRYSTLVPNEYFTINFNEIMSYQIALYICKILYIEKSKKKKDKITITLNSVMKNTSKFITSEKYGTVKWGCSLYYYDGKNTKRYWDSTIKKVNELLEKLKYENKIKNHQIFCQTINTYYGINYEYENVKWIIEI